MVSLYADPIKLNHNLYTRIDPQHRHNCLKSDKKYAHIHLFIAVPIDAGISSGFVDSVQNLMSHLKEKKIKATYYQLANDSLITRARNNLVASFLRHAHFTHFLFIDSDLTFSPQAVIRLLDFNKPVSAAAYPLKTVDYDGIIEEGKKSDCNKETLPLSTARFVLNLITDVSDADKGADGQMSLPIQNMFTKVSETGTGFLMIHRAVFYKMMKELPNDWFRNDVSALVPLQSFGDKLNIKLFWTFFDQMIHAKSRRYLSEDYAFCQKWRDMGGDVWLDLSQTIFHTGPHAFGGNLYLQLARKGAIRKADDILNNNVLAPSPSID